MNNNERNNSKGTNPRKNRRIGSALAAVFILCTVTAMVAGSALSTATSERRMNQIAALSAEARNAAEAIVEFGLADLQQRFTDHNSFASDELASENDPLTLPDAFYTLFSGSNVVMPDKPYDGTVAYGTYSTEIIGGTVPDAGWTFIDSSIPGNEDDVLADRKVSVRQVRVYGRATVKDGTGRTAVAHCRESLQVRDAPLFSYAIFYNMDLEIAPGVNMTLTGPVHTNGDLYAAPNPTSSTTASTSAPSSSVTLKFTDVVTAVGGIYHSLPDGYNNYGTNTSADMHSGTGDVVFADDDGNYVSMWQSSENRWLTSSCDDWYDTSKDLWDENVQDKSYSTRQAKSVAFSDYVADDPSTSAVDDALNYAYQEIMPLVDKNVTSTSGGSPIYDESIEEQKYAYKAGLVIVVNTNSTNGITGFSLYYQSFDSDGALVYSGNAPKRTLLCSVTSTYGNPITATYSTSASTFSSTYMNSTVWCNLFGTPTTSTSTKYYYTTPTGKGTATAGTGDIYAYETSSSNNATYSTGSGSTASPYRYYSNSGIFRICNYYNDGTHVTSGMYDARRLQGIDILEIDMGKLRTALLADDARLWSESATSATDDNYTARNWWNGVIYVEFSYDSTDTVGNDNVKKCVDGYGVRLTDAKASGSGTSYVSGIPGNMTSSTYSNWDNYESLTGTTVATNNVLYVLGSYNADGSSSTGSSTAVDDSNEPAASLAADAITFLSSSWIDYNSALAKAKRTTTTFTEISAAIITGIVATNKSSNDHASGGAHNLPRFLESWSGTVRYRGSMVCLYESEVANGYFSMNYFDPPTRDWGFNEQYSNGIYPPGTPLLRTFKRVDFKFISDSDWTSEISNL